jgi:hypothetical protein
MALRLLYYCVVAVHPTLAAVDDFVRLENNEPAIYESELVNSVFHTAKVRAQASLPGSSGTLMENSRRNVEHRHAMKRSLRSRIYLFDETFLSRKEDINKWAPIVSKLGSEFGIAEHQVELIEESGEIIWIEAELNGTERAAVKKWDKLVGTHSVCAHQC